MVYIERDLRDAKGLIVCLACQASLYTDLPFFHSEQVELEKMLFSPLLITSPPTRTPTSVSQFNNYSNINTGISRLKSNCV